MSKLSDQWATPPDFFHAVENLLNIKFDLDVCASKDNHKCDKYYTEEDDGLLREWKCKNAWCNPPYSDVEPWLTKANEEAIIKRNCEYACVLTHAGIGTKWARKHINYCENLFLINPRVQFLPPPGVKSSSNSRDSVLWVYYCWEKQYIPHSPISDQIDFFNWK